MSVVVVALSPTAVYAQTSLQDLGFNVNGTYYPSTLTVPGLTSSSFDTTTGLGTLTLTFDPGKAGSYNFDAWFFDELAFPGYNEHGAVSGSLAAGQSWQIGIPDYDSDGNYTGTIISNTTNNALNNTNQITGGGDNSGDICTGKNCNDYTSLALGWTFTLAANQEETITLCLSSPTAALSAEQSCPVSSFTLEQVHPVDAYNTAATDVFYSGNAATSTVGGPPPPPPVVPEPASWGLLATGLVIAGFTQRQRCFRAMFRA
jgi:hypothetical protein